jgi:DNA-binding NarL/FixJ family response regulator/signal transduction histidine kinase
MTKIIIVDDHSLVRMGIKGELKCNCSDVCVVGEAENGKRFFELLKTTEADLVLLDIMMPEMNGIEVARRLRKDYPELKILIISVETSFDIVQQLLEIGIDGFLSKQLCVGENLAEAIRCVMDGTSYFGKDIAEIISDIYAYKTKTTTENFDLTWREREIINLCHSGLRSKEIADKLNISPRTVENHKTNIFKKLGINNSSEMVQYALKNGVIQFDMINFINQKSQYAKHSTNKNGGGGKSLFINALCFFATLCIKGCILVAFLFSANVANAQTNIVERLLQMEQEVASGELSDDVKFDHLLKLIDNYRTRDAEKARLYFKKAIAFAREKKNIKWESSYFSEMGFAYSQWDKKDTALMYFDDALKLIEGKDFYKEESTTYRYRGAYFRRINNHEQAMADYLKAIELNEKDKAQNIANKQDTSINVRAEVMLTINISNIYSNLRNFEKTMEYLLSAKTIIDRNRTIDFGQTERTLLGNLSGNYMQMGDYEKSLPYAEKYYELSVAAGDLRNTVFALNRLSDAYRIYFKDFNKALKYATEAAEIAEKTNDPNLVTLGERLLLRAYLVMKDFEKALYYAERILSKTDENDWATLEDLYGQLTRIYAFLGDVENSGTYLLRYKELLTKISDKNLHNAVQEVQVKHEVDKKELEIGRQRLRIGLQQSEIGLHQSEIERQQLEIELQQSEIGLQQSEIGLRQSEIERQQMEIELQQSEMSRQRVKQNMLIGGLVGLGLLLVLLGFVVRLRNQRNRELAEINITKDKFISIISHDLKNPALLQRNILKLLVEKGSQFDAETIAQYHAELLKSADSNVHLLFNLLNWAQTQTRRISYHPVSFNLSAYLQQNVVQLSSDMAKHKGIELVAELPNATIVTGDKNMLVTVVRNLLDNAIKYTSSGGQVKLSVEPTDKGKFIVSVSDTGVGMSAEQIQNLFRLDLPNSKNGTAGEIGSGLGLIVCKELLEKHGSRLNVESTVGAGCRVWFEV